MEEGADVIVACKILDEARILVGELRDLLAQADSRSIHDGEVAPKGLQQFHRAGFKHCP
jgi:methylmalonyl-CoA mutase cobalamin-binding subunit